MHVVDWLVAYDLKMQNAKDVGRRVFWNFHGVKMRNGVKTENV